MESSTQKSKDPKRSNHTSQKFSLWRRFILLTLPPLMWFLIWTIYLLCRKRYFISQKIPKSNFIAIFWHGEFLMLPFAYKKIAAGKRIAIIASKHFHGEIVARVYRLFGFDTIRGSSNYNGVDRGGVKVLRKALHVLKNDSCVGLTPDGPKGPYHSVSDGVIALSKKTQIPLVPFRVKCSPAFHLSSWDKFLLPIPFSKIEYHILDPFIIENTKSMEESKQKVYQSLHFLD